MSTKATIRFEDLGEPVQKLLKSVNDYDDEDMVLLSWVKVKDMAKIYEDMAANRQAAMIWEELKKELAKRRDAEKQKSNEIDAAAQKLQEERALIEQEEPEDLEPDVPEDDEETRAAKQAKRDKKAKKKEKKLKKLAEEEARLKEEKRAYKAAKKSRKEQKQKDKWRDYVQQHPLLFDAGKDHLEIAQEPIDQPSQPQPVSSKDLVTRMYTPQCPNCHAKYSKPPARWECPMCDRKFHQKVLTWQPDVSTCGCCSCSVGRFSRHHCRNCGRVTCSKCTGNKANLPSLEFDGPQRVCNQCLEHLAPDAYAQIKAQAEEQTRKGVLSRLK